MAMKKATAAMKKILTDSGSSNFEVAAAAMKEVAKALTLPLKQGILKGNNLEGVFEQVDFEPGQAVEFPLDFLSPGQVNEFIAYTIPNVGRVPEKSVEGDYVMVPTYDVGAAIDWPLKYAKNARWDVPAKALKVVAAMHVRKNNNDGWHTLLGAGAGRNLVVYDDAATSGLFTKRLVALMRTIMRRNAGGNSTSINKGKLSDLFMSPESIEDMRSWDLSQIDEFTRRDIFLAGGDDGQGALAKIFGVVLHDIDELGVGQEYQGYYTNTLAGTMPTDKVEIVVGLDLVNRDSFVHPVRQEVEVFEDMSFHRQRRAGVYSAEESGWGCLDSRRVILGAI